MAVFIIIAIYLMPIIGFLFIVILLSAIKKIKLDRPYKAEMIWAGLFFGLIVWTIAMTTLITAD